jgi:hypothetical protein
MAEVDLEFLALHHAVLAATIDDDGVYVGGILHGGSGIGGGGGLSHGCRSVKSDEKLSNRALYDIVAGRTGREVGFPAGKSR